MQGGNSPGVHRAVNNSAPRGVRPWGKQLGKRNRKTCTQNMGSLSASPPPPLINRPNRTSDKINEFVLLATEQGQKRQMRTRDGANFQFTSVEKGQRCTACRFLLVSVTFAPSATPSPFLRSPGHRHRWENGAALETPTTAGKARNATAPRYPKCWSCRQNAARMHLRKTSLSTRALWLRGS